jgi:fumarate hydratase class I
MKAHFVELIRRASSVLPSDVEAALKFAAGREEEGSMARRVIRSLLENAAEAAKASMPICQDTGTLIFKVTYGPEFSQTALENEIKAAVVEATANSYLRPNAVDPITGRNSGNNIGVGSPLFFFFQRPEKGLRASLMLKGGGSENVSIQYTLPDPSLKAGRDLFGVRKCILDAAFRAQGFGCAPGTLGVGIGGDRMSSYMCAKEQLFRRLDDVNRSAGLAALEGRCLEEINTLGIGPMGYGGRTTVLGVKIGLRHRVPASYFVSVAYMCWAFRRCLMKLDGGNAEYSS